MTYFWNLTANISKFIDFERIAQAIKPLLRTLHEGRGQELVLGSWLLVLGRDGFVTRPLKQRIFTE